jgi:hypothetical protein
MFAKASHRVADQSLLSWAPPRFGRHVKPFVLAAFEHHHEHVWLYWVWVFSMYTICIYKMYNYPLFRIHYTSLTRAYFGLGNRECFWNIFLYFHKLSNKATKKYLFLNITRNILITTIPTWYGWVPFLDITHTTQSQKPLLEPRSNNRHYLGFQSQRHRSIWVYPCSQQIDQIAITPMGTKSHLSTSYWWVYYLYFLSTLLWAASSSSSSAY